MNKFIHLSAIAVLSSVTFFGFSNPVKAQDDVSCVTDGTTAVCADSAGNVGVSTVNSDGSQTTVGVGADGSTSVEHQE